jgi:hypothetical protein
MEAGKFLLAMPAACKIVSFLNPLFQLRNKIRRCGMAMVEKGGVEEGS